MTESIKTAAFLLVAVALLLVVWAQRPSVPGPGEIDDAGELFFAEFTDPLTASSLTIVEFDEANATPRAFEVARHDGVWSIPSHENYPADAENRFADAAASMIGLTKGLNVSDRPADHELYGVIDPAQTGAGAAGVGKRVTLTAGDGRVWADLIIGKEVKESPGQRYVRLPGTDRVYLCAIDTQKFATEFEEWIEKDLLDLASADITEIVANDYSIDEFSQRLIQGETLNLAYDTTGFEWSLEGLGPDEQLDSAKINDMRRALDDLKIVDVHRKPAGLSAELRAEDTLQLDTEAVRSLQSRGYFIVQGRLLSNQGETFVRTRDGVQYTLRFGEIALTAGGNGGDGTGDEAESSSSGTGRYLFITAEFKPDLVPEPALAELPDLEALGIPTESGDEEATEGQPSISEAMELAREKIEQDNQTRQQEHEQKLTDGRSLASELNGRFADWYYVISDDVYSKIRLRRDDIVKPAEPEEQQEPE